MVLDEKEKGKLLKYLRDQAQDSQDPEKGANDPESVLYQEYSIETQKGKAFYESLPDHFLTDLLKEKAEVLGHSPAQREMFWVWREYIKARFKRWPYALKAAGLSKAAGREGKSREQFEREKEEHFRLVRMMQEQAAALCRIPHPGEIPEIEEAMRKQGAAWTDLVREAGLDGEFFRKRAVYPVEDLSAQERQDLNLIWETAWKLGRPPLKKELPEEKIRRLIQKCGSYRNVLFQIGLEPVEKKRPFLSAEAKQAREGEQRKHQVDFKDCYYPVLNKEQQYQEDLQSLQDWIEKAGRLPERSEIDPAVRKRLQTACGSWSNAVKQLEYRKNLKEKPYEEKNCGNDNGTDNDCGNA